MIFRVYVNLSEGIIGGSYCTPTISWKPRSKSETTHCRGHPTPFHSVHPLGKNGGAKQKATTYICFFSANVCILYINIYLYVYMHKYMVSRIVCMFSFNLLTMNLFGVSVIPKTASATHRMLGAASTAIDSYGNPIFQCCLALTHNVGNPGYHKQLPWLGIVNISSYFFLTIYGKTRVGLLLLHQHWVYHNPIPLISNTPDILSQWCVDPLWAI